MTVIDNNTFKISFPKPYGGFIRNMWIEGWKGYTLVINPSHFLKKYHAKYADMNSQAMKDEMAKMNLKDEWWQIFANKRCAELGHEQPALRRLPRPLPVDPQGFGQPQPAVMGTQPVLLQGRYQGPATALHRQNHLAAG